MCCMVHLSTVLICTIYICYCYRSWLSFYWYCSKFPVSLSKMAHTFCGLFLCLFVVYFISLQRSKNKINCESIFVCAKYIKIGNKYYDDDDHSRPRGTSQALAMLNAKLPTRFVKFRNERNANDTKKNNNKRAWRLEDFYLVVRRVQIRIVRSTYLWRDLN